MQTASRILTQKQSFTSEQGRKSSFVFSLHLVHFKLPLHDFLNSSSVLNSTFHFTRSPNCHKRQRNPTIISHSSLLIAPLKNTAVEDLTPPRTALRRLLDLFCPRSVLFIISLLASLDIQILMFFFQSMNLICSLATVQLCQWLMRLSILLFYIKFEFLLSLS